MPQKKKLQVFISSTYEDLKEDRQAAVQAVLTAKHIPAGMELFTAGDESQMNVIKRWIDESDVYMLILGGRYGSIEPKSGKSYTHLEFEYAIQQGKPLFSVVIRKEALEKRIKEVGSKVMEQDNPQKLRELRDLVESKIVRHWDDAKDIKLAVLETLNEFSDRPEMTGWVRSSEVTDITSVVEEMARLNKLNANLSSENEEIKQQIADLQNSQEKNPPQYYAADENDYIITLRNYIGTTSPTRRDTKVIDFMKADKALGFPADTSKRCFPEAIKGTGYQIVAQGRNTVEIRSKPRVAASGSVPVRY